MATCNNRIVKAIGTMQAGVLAKWKICKFNIKM
jgi:hypothetical protein